MPVQRIWVMEIDPTVMESGNIISDTVSLCNDVKSEFLQEYMSGRNRQTALGFKVCAIRPKEIVVFHVT